MTRYFAVAGRRARIPAKDHRAIAYCAPSPAGCGTKGRTTCTGIWATRQPGRDTGASCPRWCGCGAVCGTRRPRATRRSALRRWPRQGLQCMFKMRHCCLDGETTDMAGVSGKCSSCHQPTLPMQQGSAVRCTVRTCWTLLFGKGVPMAGRHAPACCAPQRRPLPTPCAGGSEGNGQHMAWMRWSQTANFGSLPAPARVAPVPTFGGGCRVCRTLLLDPY
eukprot:gene10654-biopygen7784